MNIALIKHDGAALNLPANYIQAIVPLAATDEAPDARSLIVSSFRGGTTFPLQDTTVSVYESVVFHNPNAAEAWVSLEKGDEKTYFQCATVEGFDAIGKESWRAWIKFPGGMETTEIFDYTDHNQKELERAVNANNA